MKSKKPEARDPDLKSEAASGFFLPGTLIIGVDEVGRGCLAGPVVAGAAALDPKILAELGFNESGKRPAGLQDHPLLRVRDSKLIPEDEREPLSRELASVVSGFEVAEATVEEISELNILHASQLAMARAVESLERKLGRRADRVWVDGNRVPEPLRDRGAALVKGDLKCLSIAVASVFAKVHRDRLMSELEIRYPGYGLSRHKGYPTPAHQAAIREYGATPIHRRGFKGV